MSDPPSSNGRGTRRRSLDLAALVVYAVVGPTILLLLDFPAAARTLLGVPLVLFAPGYAVVAVVLPRRFRPSGSGGLDGLERLVVAVGASVAVVVLGSLAVAPLFEGGLAAVPYRPLLAVTTGVLCCVAYARRRRRRATERAGIVDPRSLGGEGTPRIVDLALVLAVLLAVGTLGYGLAVPRESTDYTSVSLLTENESGDYVAGGYPDEAVVGEPTTVTVAIRNDEGGDRTYTVVAVVERLGPDGERTLQRRELARETVSVEAGETVRSPVTVRPDTLGERLRFSYYVYRGEFAGPVAPEDADRHVYLWLSVVPDGGSE